MLGTALPGAASPLARDPGSAALLCQPEGSEETMQLPVQVLTKAELMGELAALQALPIYQ